MQRKLDRVRLHKLIPMVLLRSVSVLLSSSSLLLLLLVVVLGVDSNIPSQASDVQVCSDGNKQVPTTSTTTTTCPEPALETEVHLQDKTNPRYDDNDDDDDDISDVCDLFLAPSTIEGAGLGVFVGSPKNVGDVVGLGDVAIPMVDLPFHHGYRRFFSHFHDYRWNGADMGMQQESDAKRGIEAFCPGIDAAVNCHFGLLNLGLDAPIHDVDMLLHRSTHPGAGAITLYYNSTNRMTNPVPAGGELFKNYGTKWFKTRQKQFGRVVPFPPDYESAERLCQQWHLTIQHTPHHIKDDLWSSVVAKVPFLWNQKSRLGGGGGGVGRVLPTSPHQARAVALHGIRSMYQPNATRTVEFLRKSPFSRCMDSIRPGPSTLPQAGRGGFATRNFAKGDIVTGSPLLHAFRSFFVMYDAVEKEDDEDGTTSWTRNTNRIVGQQLLLNYCFGHYQSTLLLCPYSAGVAWLNHNQTLRNVVIRWAPHGQVGQNDDWLDRKPIDFKHNHTVHLGMDFVATRDIQEGEELFLDYGNVWEDAWNHHVQNWEPHNDDAEYAPASVWNAENGKSPLRTHDEQQEEPYPDHLYVRCHPALHLATPSWEDWYEQTKEEKGTIWSGMEKGWDCRIVERYWDDETEDYVYSIELYVEDRRAVVVETVMHDHVPRDAFQYVDREYSTDMHLEGTFRREMQLPEEMVPKAWRNLAAQED